MSMIEKRYGYVVVSVKDLRVLLEKAVASIPVHDSPRQSGLHCVSLDLELKPDSNGQIQAQIPVRYTHGDAVL